MRFGKRASIYLRACYAVDVPFSALAESVRIADRAHDVMQPVGRHHRFPSRRTGSTHLRPTTSLPLVHSSVKKLFK